MDGIVVHQKCAQDLEIGVNQDPTDIYLHNLTYVPHLAPPLGTTSFEVTAVTVQSKPD